jgi:hypothetical protein
MKQQVLYQGMASAMPNYGISRALAPGTTGRG